MRPILCLAILSLLMLAACPSGGGSGSSGSGNAQVSPAGDTPAATGSDDGAVGANGSASANGEGIEIAAGPYSLAGVRLGAGWERAQRALPGGGFTRDEIWVEEGVLGMVSATPESPDEVYPEHTVVMYAGQLAGITTALEMDANAYSARRAEVVESYGEPTLDPPAWAQDTPFFSGYEPAEDGSEAVFWGDAESRAVMIALYDFEEEHANWMLVNVDYFDTAVGELMAKATEDMMARMQEELGAAGTEDGAVAITDVGDCPFFLDGFTLGAPYEIVRADYPEDSLLVSDMWADEGVTGMFGASPADLSTPYPSIAAWFYDGAMTGYIRTEQLTPDQFTVEAEALEFEYGIAADEPPQWLLDTPYMDQYEEPGLSVEQYIWDDEASTSVMFAQYDYETELATFMLFDVYLFPAAKEATLSSLGYGGEGEAGEQ
jgi:hypothetical protein